MKRVVVALVVSMVWFLAATRASAQSCPEYVSGVSLDRRLGPEESVIAEHVCSASGNCYMLCKYGTNPSLPELKATLEWRPSSAVALPQYPGTCINSTAGNVFISRTNQALVSWFPGPARGGAELARGLLGQAEAQAAACPQPVVPGRGRNNPELDTSGGLPPLRQTNRPPTPRSDQTWPAKILDLELSNPLAMTVDCFTAGGRTQCSLWCPYNDRIIGRATADLKIKWVTSAEDGVAPMEFSCGPRPDIPFGQRHPNRQATAAWAGSQSDIAAAVKAKALELLNEVGESAIPCKPITVRTSQEETGGLPPPPPYCNSGKPQGKIRNPVGKVELYSYAFDKWKGPITSEFPVMACDRVRTGDQSSATVFIFTPSGAEDRIDLMSDTILEIPGLSIWETEHNTPPSEGFIIDLIKGTIRWFTPETAGERRRREQVNENPFNVRTPTVAVGDRGTDFILRHDPVQKKDYVLLNSGLVELAAGNKTVLLEPGQQIFTENKAFSAVYELKPDIWDAVVAQKTIPGANVFANARKIDAVSGDEGASTEKTGSRGGTKVEAPVGTRFTVFFQGRRYDSLYQRQFDEGKPIDVYFFEVKGPNGLQAEQDGAKLWGRFVRFPALGAQIESKTIFWYLDWIFKSGRWETVTSKGESFEVLGSPK